VFLHVTIVIKNVNQIFLNVESSVDIVNIQNISLITLVVTNVLSDIIILNPQSKNVKYVPTHVNGALINTSVLNVDITT
jgi:hypothetical protein